VLQTGALKLAADVDLDGVPICSMCVFDLAWEIHEGRTPSRGLLARTVDWVWMESGEGVRQAVVRARMEERAFAEEALRDIEVNGHHGKFAEAVVWRLASEMAEEMGRRR
jgi:hypothetical protein